MNLKLQPLLCCLGFVCVKSDRKTDWLVASFCHSVGELWLERPLETAMLLSLVGVASVVSNQWHCQLVDNRHKLDTCLVGEFVFWKLGFQCFSVCHSVCNKTVPMIPE